jgi:D-cysteine desulfhydrase
MAVCDDTATFIERIQAIISEIHELDPGLRAAADLRVLDDWKGPAYAVATQEQLRFIVEVGRCSGIILDPVYTGKALFGLWKRQSKPKRALFLHTGGLPGLLAQSADFSTGRLLE